MGSSKPKLNESLAVLFPDLAAQAVGWDPKTAGRRTDSVVAWVVTRRPQDGRADK